MFSVKKCQLFEGVSPSSVILNELFLGARNAHKANKTDFLRNRQRLKSIKNYHSISIMKCIKFVDAAQKTLSTGDMT